MLTEWDYLDAAYAKVEGNGGGRGVTLPTGTYQAKLIKAQMDTSKWVFERQFQVLSGEYVNCIHRDWIHLIKKDGGANEVSLDRIKSEMRKLDPDYADMPLSQSYKPFLEASIDQIVEIYVKTETSKGHFNEDGTPKINSTTYINAFINAPTSNDTPF